MELVHQQELKFHEVYLPLGQKGILEVDPIIFA